jgi:hypothetical protein
MPIDLLDAVIELPFVVLTIYLTQRFLVYLNQRDAEWHAFLTEADERLIARMTALTEAVNRLSERIVMHDMLTRSHHPEEHRYPREQ